MTSPGDTCSSLLDSGAIASLLELVGDDPDALTEIVDAFVDEAPLRLAELSRGIEIGDALLVGRAAHTLKANSRTFGAIRLAGLCEEIEGAARAGDLAPARVRAHEVDDAWIGVRGALVALRESARDGA